MLDRIIVLCWIINWHKCYEKGNSKKKKDKMLLLIGIEEKQLKTEVGKNGSMLFLMLIHSIRCNLMVKQFK